MKRPPIIPTIIVLAAVATMIALGFWQLDRRAEKEALIARSQAALTDDTTILSGGFAEQQATYRRAMFLCESVENIRSASGRNAAGQAGLAHIARCRTGGAASYAPLDMPDHLIETVDVTLGWSRNLAEVNWQGGEVAGRIGPPDGDVGRVIADPPLAGLDANAPPDPGTIPNNHLAYAGQWFFFAFTALVIYALALRRRRRSEA